MASEKNTTIILLRIICGIILLSVAVSCHTIDTQQPSTVHIRIYRPEVTEEVTVYINGRMVGVGDSAALSALKSVKLRQAGTAYIKLYSTDTFRLVLSTGSPAPKPYMLLFFKSSPKIIDEYNKLTRRANCLISTNIPVDTAESREEILSKLHAELISDIKNDLSGGEPKADRKIP